MTIQATEISHQGAIETRREFDGSGIISELVWSREPRRLLGCIWRDGRGEPWKARLMNRYGSGWDGHYTLFATRGDALHYLTNGRI